MGLLDALGKLGFIEISEEKQDDPERPVTASSPPQAPEGRKVLSVSTTEVSAIDDIARQKLGAAMDGAGTKLVEELADTLGTLETVIPDEALRYKTAIGLLEKRDINVVAIVGNFDACSGALESEVREFSSQLQGQFDKRVGTKVQLVAKLDLEMATKRAEIDKLTSEISEISGRREVENVGISEEQRKLDLTKSRFEAIYASLRSSVESQKAKLMKHGGMV